MHYRLCKGLVPVCFRHSFFLWPTGSDSSFGAPPKRIGVEETPHGDLFAAFRLEGSPKHAYPPNVCPHQNSQSRRASTRVRPTGNVVPSVSTSSLYKPAASRHRTRSTFTSATSPLFRTDRYRAGGSLRVSEARKRWKASALPTLSAEAKRPSLPVAHYPQADPTPTRDAAE